MIMAFLGIVCTLILVVGLHELGHALAARLLHVAISRISLGFGPPILQWQDKKGTQWVWAVWPLGGYVALLNTRVTPVDKSQYPVCFDKQSIRVRLAILLAGPVASLLTAFAAFFLYFCIGYTSTSPVIQAVMPESIFAQANVNADDKIISIGDEKTDSWQDIGTQLITALGKNSVKMVVQKADGSIHSTTLNLHNVTFISGKTLFFSLGIPLDPKQFKTITVPGKSWQAAIAATFHKIAALLEFFLLVLKQLLLGIIPFSMLLGPLGFLGASAMAFMQGLAIFLNFIGVLSLVVGLVNLFPFPGLDGGSIMYCLLEKIRGKPVSVAWELLLHRLALIALIILLVQLSMNDLLRYLTA